VKLVAFKKFKDIDESVKSLRQFLEGEMPKDLKKFLKKNIISEEIEDKLLCFDKKTAKLIKSTMEIDCIYGEQYLELFRGIRLQLSNLISGNLSFFLIVFLFSVKNVEEHLLNKTMFY
jgi:hypothetical protein